MLRISVKFCALALGVSGLIGCQRPADGLHASETELEKIAHDAGSCPNLPTGTYFIAGLPENQRESITVGVDNRFSNKVYLTVETRTIEVLPTGDATCNNFDVKTDDRICYRGGCQNGAFVVVYKGKAGGKFVSGKKAIRPASGNSLQVTEASGNREYRKM